MALRNAPEKGKGGLTVADKKEPVAGKNESVNGKTRINRVFVYGTLMKGFGNHRRYLEGRISCITPGKTRGLLYHLPQGYPALLEGDEIVEGEIVEPVDENLLESLDRLEDYSEGRSNNLYVRVARNILEEDGKEVTCWVYIYADRVYAQAKGTLVPDGNWRSFIEKRRRY